MPLLGGSRSNSNLVNGRSIEILRDMIVIGCHMVLYNQKDFDGYDAPNYRGIMKPYHEAFRNCFINNCVGLVWNGASNLCYLKIKTEEETGTRMNSNSNSYFWKAVCQ
ncbi:uncharacterized protein LOC135210693 [Macrobrachium nipponense]|uniref:uncharacterized protein LOC135210693 n=1 Tax=Macrobrachium nipponense TaxID=159736 RepID=UPI0030C8C351